MILPILKFELIVPGRGKLDISGMIEASNITITQERNDTSSVSVESSMPIELKLKAADWLKEEFEAKGLYAEASLACYWREDATNNYIHVKTFLLDFEQYEDSDTGVTIATRADTMSEYVKSYGKTKYDIPVSDVVEPKQWIYDRMTLKASANYTIPTTTFNSTKQNLSSFFIYFSSMEVPPGGLMNEGQDQQQETAKAFFFRALSDVEVDVVMRFGIKTESIIADSFQITKNHLSLVVSSQDGLVRESVFIKKYEKKSGEMFHRAEIDTVKRVSLKKGETLSFETELVYVPGVGWTTYAALQPYGLDEGNNPELRVQWDTKGVQINIGVVKPEKMLQHLIDLMAPEESYKASIAWGELNYIPMICAAETIRGMEKDTFHISYNNFHEWMRTMGYEREYTDTGMLYKMRSECFKKDVLAISLKESEVADMRRSGAKDYAYTSIEIGYEKKEYESANGYFEVNGLFHYTTGYKTKNGENKLALISPFRADSIGIELLSWNRFETGTDSKSDNDVFVIAMQEMFDYYQEDRTRFANVSVELFNYHLNPQEMAKRNASLFGIITDQLKFKSTTSYRESNSIHPAVFITEKLFEPYFYNFAVGSRVKLPESDLYNGIVTFVYRGVQYKGFVKKIEKNYGAEEEMIWELWAVK